MMQEEIPNFFGNQSIYHENTVFNGAADRASFYKMFQSQDFNKLLDYGETKFEAIRANYQMLCDVNRDMLATVRVKSSKESIKYRENGNEFFKNMDYKQALNSYQKALCFAKTAKEKSFCYGNLSAVYFALKDPEACLGNIKLAIEMHSPETGEDKFLDKLHLREKNCERLEKRPVIQDLLLSYAEHENVPGLSKNVGLKEPGTKNQQLYAKESMKYGDVIAVTEAIQVSLGRTYYIQEHGSYHFCYNCGITSFPFVIPCDTCCVIRFCSEACKEANMVFHVLECEDINYCHSLFEPEVLLTLRLTYRFLNVGMDFSKTKHSSFDSMTKDKALKNLAKVIFEFKDSDIDFDEAFKLAKRCVGLRDMFRPKKEYKNLISRFDDGEKVFWNMFGRIHKKVVTGSFCYNYIEFMQNIPGKFIDYGSHVDWFHGMFQHSCLPNVLVYRPKHTNKNFYVLLENVKAGDQLTISYS